MKQILQTRDSKLSSKDKKYNIIAGNLEADIKQKKSEIQELWKENERLQSENEMIETDLKNTKKKLIQLTYESQEKLDNTEKINEKKLQETERIWKKKL